MHIHVPVEVSTFKLADADPRQNKFVTKISSQALKDLGFQNSLVNKVDMHADRHTHPRNCFLPE